MKRETKYRTKVCFAPSSLLNWPGTKYNCRCSDQEDVPEGWQDRWRKAEQGAVAAGPLGLRMPDINVTLQSLHITLLAWIILSGRRSPHSFKRWIETTMENCPSRSSWERRLRWSNCFVAWTEREMGASRNTSVQSSFFHIVLASLPAPGH